MLSCLSLRRFSSTVIVWASLSAGMSVQASSVLLPGAKPSSQQRLSVWGFDVYDARVWVRPDFSILKYADHLFEKMQDDFYTKAYMTQLNERHNKVLSICIKVNKKALEAKAQLIQKGYKIN